MRLVFRLVKILISSVQPTRCQDTTFYTRAIERDSHAAVFNWRKGANPRNRAGAAQRILGVVVSYHSMRWLTSLPALAERAHLAQCVPFLPVVPREPGPNARAFSPLVPSPFSLNPERPEVETPFRPSATNPPMLVTMATARQVHMTSPRTRRSGAWLRKKMNRCLTSVSLVLNQTASQGKV
jgi:hypothetical protein